MIKRTNNLDKNKTINRRLFILGSAKVGLLGLITSRLYNLQISEKTKYETLSNKNRFREWKTPPKRGVITDFYNNIIADNKRVYQVYLSLDETKDFNNSIFKLKNIINLSDDELKNNNSFKDYEDRLNHELSIIIEMKYSSYFLIVADYIKWAKNNDIPVGPGRGSGACLLYTSPSPRDEL